MNFSRRQLVMLALGVIALGVLFLSGCATGSDGQNVSERPWNQPERWETGLPSGLTEGR